MKLGDIGEMHMGATAAVGLFPRVEIDPADLVELCDLAAEALRRREVFGLAKLACQRSEQQGAHFYIVDLETMEALIAAVRETGS